MSAALLRNVAKRQGAYCGGAIANCGQCRTPPGRSWCENGQPIETHTVDMGKKTGDFRSWYENGSKFEQVTGNRSWTIQKQTNADH